MASQWGSNRLAPGTSAGWFFARPNVTGFLPVLQVMPLTPQPFGNLWSVAGDGYPSWNELGVSTIWSQLSDDLSTLVFLMVVTNNSNNIVEYPFLEADPAGPANATAPAAGLGSNSNYLLSDNCNPITNLTVTIDVTEDIAGSDGFGFQVNAYSASGDYDGGQQYLIFLSPGGDQLSCMIDNWTLQSTGVKIIKVIVPQRHCPVRTCLPGTGSRLRCRTMPAVTLPAPHTWPSITTETRWETSPSRFCRRPIWLRAIPATAADVAPIAAFQLDFVDFLNGGDTTLPSGAGTITYTASNPMTALSTEPACVDWSYVTLETPNSIYGPPPTGSSQTFAQSFGHGPASGVIRKTAQVMKKTMPWVAKNVSTWQYRATRACRSGI